MTFWAVVQTESHMLARTKARSESLAEYLFHRIGFECYLPRVRKPKIAPLFPGYIFVRIIDHWAEIARTMGVVRVLMPLPQQALDDIRSREYRGFVRLPHKPRFRRGQQVRIVNGQFDGHLGVYDGQSAREREHVLLDLLGRQVRVELAKGDLVEPLVSGNHLGY